MPTPQVVATLPFKASAVATRSSFKRLSPSGGPATLSFVAATSNGSTSGGAVATRDDDAYDQLLEEATDLARTFGCEVRRRVLGGFGGGGGYRWVRGRLQIVLDLDANAGDRLEVVADALRGEPRLTSTPMSDALAAYLCPRRAA